MSNKKFSEIDLHKFFTKCTEEPNIPHVMPKSKEIQGMIGVQGHHEPKEFKNPNNKSKKVSRIPHKSNFASPSIKYRSNTRNVPPFISLNYNQSSKITQKNSFLIIKMKTGLPRAKTVLRISEP